MDPGRTCPSCRSDLEPTFEDVDSPDGWVRHQGAATWDVSATPPRADEQPAEIAYRCTTCRRTYRLLDRHNPFLKPKRKAPE